jgi:hypothetical protein
VRVFAFAFSSRALPFGFLTVAGCFAAEHVLQYPSKSSLCAQVAIKHARKILKFFMSLLLHS